MTDSILSSSRFLSPVRVPRYIVENSFSHQSRMIASWAERIARNAKEIGGEVTIFLPDINSNKILVCGNERNVVVAAGLIRKAVIEISQDTFDPPEMLQTMEKAFEKHLREKANAASKIASCRVDFKFSLDNMNRAQSDSFEKLTELFSKVGVDVSRVENRPTVLNLTSEDKEALKGAKLTAEWAAKVIEKQHSITNNRLIQNFEVQSIKALGRERGREVAQLAMV